MILCQCRQSRGRGGDAETLRHALQHTAQAHGLDATTHRQRSALLRAYFADLRQPACMPLACGSCALSLLTLLDKEPDHVHDHL
jgi:hypothetical protein